MKGFTLRYNEISQECGGQITLTKFADTTVLQSPNFPEIPPPHIECVWTIYGVPGDRIRIDFMFLDLTRTIDCKSEYVEVRDGGTSASTLVDRYCQELPSSIFMSDNVAYVKFYTDVEDPRSGFQAKLTMANCGGTIRTVKGVLHYPPKLGASSAGNCTWHIVGPIDYTMALHFNKIRMNCELGYVTISEFNLINQTQRVLKQFCEESDDFVMPNNEVYVEYHALALNSQNEFSLTYNATQDGMYHIAFYLLKLIFYWSKEFDELIELCIKNN